MNARERGVVLSFNHIWHEQARSAGANPPQVLYHYTTGVGFRGILEGRFLRASEYRKATDTYELQHAERPILKAAKALAQTFDSRSAARTVLDRAYEEFDRLRVRNLPGTPIYLVSLTTGRDDAALWNSRYGDDGEGLCLGFRVLSERRTDIHSQRLGMNFVRVVYDLDAQGREFSEYARKAVERLELSQASRSGAVRTDCLTTILALAASVCSATKSSDYTFEKEWRVILLPAPGYTPELIDDRYIQWPLRARPDQLPALESVCLGPQHSESIESTRAYLQGLGYGQSGQEPLPEIWRSQRGVPVHAPTA